MRDNFVRRAISRMDRCSRSAQRRIMLKNAMSITPLSPAVSSRGEGVTWVNSQWKLYSYPGHFRVKINKQGFLAAQDWWDYATDPLRGLRQEDDYVLQP